LATQTKFTYGTIGTFGDNCGKIFSFSATWVVRLVASGAADAVDVCLETCTCASFAGCLARLVLVGICKTPIAGSTYYIVALAN